MNQPKILFKLDKEQDKDNLRYYLSQKSSYTGQDAFSKLIMKYPELNVLRDMNEKDREELINSFVDSKYNELKEELKQNLEDVKKEWAKISPYFFKEASKVFDGHSFPSGDYNVYLTIFHRFRCDEKNKRFFVPRNLEFFSINSVMVHELLHILFYDFVQTHFHKMSYEEQRDIAEVVITILMNQEPFVQFAGHKSEPYPSHKELYDFVNSEWDTPFRMKKRIDWIWQVLYVTGENILQKRKR